MTDQDEAASMLNEIAGILGIKPPEPPESTGGDSPDSELPEEAAD